MMTPTANWQQSCHPTPYTLHPTPYTLTDKKVCDFAKVYRLVPVFLCNNRVTGEEKRKNALELVKIRKATTNHWIAYAWIVLRTWIVLCTWIELRSWIAPLVHYWPLSTLKRPKGAKNDHSRFNWQKENSLARNARYWIWPHFSGRYCR